MIRSYKGFRVTLIALIIALYPQISSASDTLTIGDVAAMEPQEAIKYVHHEASKRGLELGIKHGDAVLNCIKAEFVGVKKDQNGDYVIPRGLKAAIRLVHVEDNNGGSSLSAAPRISSFVDYVAGQVCGVPESTSQ